MKTPEYINNIIENKESSKDKEVWEQLRQTDEVYIYIYINTKYQFFKVQIRKLKLISKK